MATRLYHINSDGEARPCGARPGNCPLAPAGAKHKEFDSPEDARRWAGLELHHSNGGSFGTLALQLAEQEVRSEIQAEEDELAAREKAQRDAVRSAVARNDAMFSLKSLEDLAQARGLRKRKLIKRLETVAEEFGLEPTSGLASLYVTYLNNFEFDLSTTDGRERFRDRLLAASTIRNHPTAASGATQLSTKLHTLSKKLNDVDNSRKWELLSEDTEANDPEAIPSLTADELTRELKRADDREWYLDQWRPGATARVVNYSTGSARTAAKEKVLLGERFGQVVSEGASNGYTEEEARWFEDQQPARWDDYHRALKAEAKVRLEDASVR